MSQSKDDPGKHRRPRVGQRIGDIDDALILCPVLGRGQHQGDDSDINGNELEREKVFHKLEHVTPHDYRKRKI